MHLLLKLYLVFLDLVLEILNLELEVEDRVVLSFKVLLELFYL
jgi:hypothetical protein